MLHLRIFYMLSYVCLVSSPGQTTKILLDLVETAEKRETLADIFEDITHDIYILRLLIQNTCYSVATY